MDWKNPLPKNAPPKNGPGIMRLVRHQIQAFA
jgi:hypothetical protein